MLDFFCMELSVLLFVVSFSWCCSFGRLFVSFVVLLLNFLLNNMVMVDRCLFCGSVFIFFSICWIVFIVFFVICFLIILGLSFSRFIFLKKFLFCMVVMDNLCIIVFVVLVVIFGVVFSVRKVEFSVVVL